MGSCSMSPWMRQRDRPVSPDRVYRMDWGMDSCRTCGALLNLELLALELSNGWKSIKRHSVVQTVGQPALPNLAKSSAMTGINNTQALLRINK